MIIILKMICDKLLLYIKMLNRQIKSKKVKNLIKKFDAEDEDEH